MRYSVTGAEYQAIDVIRRLDTAAFRRVCTTAGLSNGSHPANRLILEPNPGMNSRSYMFASLVKAQEKGILGVSIQALDLLHSGSEADFIEVRGEELARQERRFIEAMATVAEPSGRSGSEIDTE